MPFFLDCGTSPNFFNQTQEVLIEIDFLEFSKPNCKNKTCLTKVWYCFGVIFPPFSRINNKLCSIASLSSIIDLIFGDILVKILVKSHAQPNLLPIFLFVLLYKILY